MGKPTNAPPPIEPTKGGGWSPPERRKPNWSYWAQMPKAELWELVALSCDLEPRDYQSPSSHRIGEKSAPEGQPFEDRLQIALVSLTSEGVGAPSNRHKTRKFAKWAIKKWQNLPAGFAQLADATAHLEAAEFEKWKLRQLWTIRETAYLIAGFEPVPPPLPFDGLEDGPVRDVYAALKDGIDLDGFETRPARGTQYNADPHAFQYQQAEPHVVLSWAANRVPPLPLPAALAELAEVRDWAAEARTLGAQLLQVQTELAQANELLRIAQSEQAEKPSGGAAAKAEGNNLRIIAALVQVLIEGGGGKGPHPDFQNQSELIAHLEAFYQGYAGLSGSHLKRVLPKARQQLTK
jgi:hypothetical protein